MEYLIDGYNVIKSSFLGKKGDIEGKVAFYEILDRYKAKHPSVIFTVVLDGFNPSDIHLLRDRRLRTVFSGDITADEYIRKRVEKGKRNDEVIVVSDDKQVQITGKLFGCKVCSVGEFLNVVYERGKSRKREKTEENDKKEVNYKTKKKIEEELKKYYEKKY